MGCVYKVVDVANIYFYALSGLKIYFIYFMLACGILFLFGVLACESALPPGYQDEIYCPVDSCLRAKKMAVGWSGPQLSFRECWRGSDGMISRPKAWGRKVDPQIKADLLSDGWHTAWCSEKKQTLNDSVGECGEKQNMGETMAWLYSGPSAAFHY